MSEVAGPRDAWLVDTIAAQATASGRAGIGIVRLSGPAAFGIVRQLLSLTKTPAHAQAKVAVLNDAGRMLDQVVVACFHAPRSYTGEDVAEISAHGAPVVLARLLDLALAAGARVAEPGEFSRRAFLNGRLDLLGVEAVHDLIAAQTLAQAHTAARQLGGALARRLAPVKEQLVRLIALLEAGMDFASGELDDVEAMPASAILGAVDQVVGPLQTLLATYQAGAIARQGLRLALVGRPNAGKSSLFNALLGRDRAIVTAVAGTTRDTLEETLELDGIPVVLVDTAGLRDSREIDVVERFGMERSREALADADLVLLVTDATEPPAPEDVALAQQLGERPWIGVLTKTDLVASQREPPSIKALIHTSVVTGEGLQELRKQILQHVTGGAGTPDDAGLNTLRQREAVDAAIAYLGAARHSTVAGQPHEVILLDLHEALTAIDRLTGVTTTDDILARIFSTFCIGK